MADLKTYEVTVNGHTTTMQLSEEDAKAYGDNARPVGGGTAPTQPAPADDSDEKSKTVKNKGR